MTDKRILFGDFEFPRIRGLDYLLDEKKPVTDYLFVNESRDYFSMYFENGFPIFTVPENSERSYCLFELKRPGRMIKFFCPEKHQNLDTAMWYFYMELFDEQGVAHVLPGQVRVAFENDRTQRIRGKPRFIEVLEGVKLATAAST
ncbi:MAG: hypothetical protein IJY16_06160 [Clostridia bacterium]|nr:hypothetical protein [Clostridia bacterium]